MNGKMAEVAGPYLTKLVCVEVVCSNKIAKKLTQELHFVQKMDKGNKLLLLMNKHKGK